MGPKTHALKTDFHSHCRIKKYKYINVTYSVFRLIQFVPFSEHQNDSERDTSHDDEHVTFP